MRSRLFERTFDVLAAVLLIAFLSPLFLIISVLLRTTLGSPVLFRQQRTGLGGREFTLYKFRTMTATVDRHGNLLPDAERLSPFGNMLRSMSLDELPEFWNVLRGDMRLVGPRPLLPAYLPRYTPDQFRRHDVKPGITGWAQINGRNALAWEDKFALDLWYVDHRSFRLDLSILTSTIKQVLAGKDVNQPGHATASEFLGRGQNAEVR